MILLYSVELIFFSSVFDIDASLVKYSIGSSMGVETVVNVVSNILFSVVVAAADDIVVVIISSVVVAVVVIIGETVVVTVNANLKIKVKMKY